MGHTYYSVYEHIIFSTKHRVPLIDTAIEARLFPYLAASISGQGCRCLIAGGHREHVHLLVLKSATLLTGELVKEIKRPSSIWLKTEGLSDFNWQSGYGAFSVSYSNIESVKKYILNQARNHNTKTWEQEYREFLEKNGIEFDERYFLD